MMEHENNTWDKFWSRLGTCTVILTCVLTPISILVHNPKYIYGETGFADGGDLYSHFTEANHVKDQLKNGITNFWFSQTSLGYPMFTAYHPLPCFFMAIAMLLFESLMSPLLVFRLVFVIILASIPVSIYKSSKILCLKPMQAISLCLLSFAMQSWRKFGLEITAFVEYGLLTQAFGMLMIFPAVSTLYRWIIMEDCKKEGAILPALITAVTLLSNFFFGILTCILGGLMMLIKVIHVEQSHSEIIHSVKNFTEMILRSMALISWWIFACLWGYRYIGGLPWRGESEDGYPFMFIVEKFTEGEIFDSKRFFPWFTILVIVGMTLHALNIAPQIHGISSVTKTDRIYSIWILLATGVSLALFLGRTTFSIFYNLIPLHTELETVKYLSAIHFCGLLHASYALSRIFYTASDILCTSLTLPGFPEENINASCITPNSIKNNERNILQTTIGFHASKIAIMFSQKKAVLVNTMLFLFVSCFIWVNNFQTIGSHLTTTEVRQDFIQELQNLRNGTVEGRMLGHRGFGSASSFDLAFLPHYTGKPGLMTYSRGYHDSLSVFYLESLKFNPERVQLFANTLRLYNVHFVVTSNTDLDDAFSKAFQFKFIAKVEDLIFYEVLHEENDYGYFDFVRIPGYVTGDLKLIRQAVLNVLELYNVNSLLLINPKKNLAVNDNVVIDVQRILWWKDWSSFAEWKVHVTWSSKGVETDSEILLDNVVKSDSWKWIYSQVIEERTIGVEYQAIVHVSDRGEDSTDAEHLLLKVTYHPFWKCFYYPVSNDFTLNMFNSSQLLDGKIYTDINHVTPNLMSASLPPGRHLVVFTYRFPGILKILAFFCGYWFVKLLSRQISNTRATKTWSAADLNQVDEKYKAVVREYKQEYGIQATTNLQSMSGDRNYENSGNLNNSNRSIYAEKPGENFANDRSNSFGSYINSSDPDEDQSDGMSTWKVTGRLRSHSIAAGRMLQGNALNVFTAMPGARSPICLPTCFSDKSTNKDSEIGKENSDDSDVRSDGTRSDSSVKVGSSDEDVSGVRRKSNKHLNDDFAHDASSISEINTVIKRSGSQISGSSEIRNDVDANANIIPATSEASQQSSRPKCSHKNVAQILMSSSSESINKDSAHSLLGLRTRLERLNEEGAEEARERQNRSKFAEFRQTYLRHKRNSLLAPPNFRK